MSKLDRVTVTLPAHLVEEMDREASNRSRFVRTAVERELERRRHERLLESVSSPHPESALLEDEGTVDWFERSAPADSSLLDPDGGTPVRWTPDSGWSRR